MLLKVVRPSLPAVEDESVAASSHSTLSDAPLLPRKEIRLVDQEQVLLLELGLGRSLGLVPLLDILVHVELEDVLGEVFGAEGKGVPRVDNLHDKVGPFAGAPELAPDFEVALERREEERLVVLKAVESTLVSSSLFCSSPTTPKLTRQALVASQGKNLAPSSRAPKRSSSESTPVDEGPAAGSGCHAASGAFRALA